MTEENEIYHLDRKTYLGPILLVERLNPCTLLDITSETSYGFNRFPSQVIK